MGFRVRDARAVLRLLFISYCYFVHCVRVSFVWFIFFVPAPERYSDRKTTRLAPVENFIANFLYTESFGSHPFTEGVLIQIFNTDFVSR